MTKTVIHTDNAPATIGAYSQAIKAGNTVYVSRQIPLDPKTMELVEGFKEQTVQVFENLRTVIEASGGYLHGIAKLNIFLTNLSYFVKVNGIMGRYFIQSHPTHAAVGVATLPKGTQVGTDTIVVLEQAGYSRRGPRPRHSTWSSTMHRVIFLAVATTPLAGCADTADPSGTWTNQAAIDAASKDGKLRKVLLVYGPNLEWRLDSEAGETTFNNGFELGEGTLSKSDDEHWKVAFYGDDNQESLELDGEELIQQASANGPKQRFRRLDPQPAANSPAGSGFERALYGSYLKGSWKTHEGQGQGGKVEFQANGLVSGLPGTERYALYLAGDCTAMSGDNDSIWLQQGNRGRELLFSLDDDELQLSEVVNTAGANEVPSYVPDRRVWLLEH